MKNLRKILTLWLLWHIRSVILLLHESPSFLELTKDPGFVDKTMLLETVFQHLNCNYHLLTYPSKFGKTSNLKMIQSFVELKADKCAHIKKKWNTTSYKVFTNKSLGLRISQHRHLIRKHLAEYPVIYITFRNIIRPTFEETIQKLSDKIRECYEKYHWLYEVLKNDSLQETSDEWGYLLRGQIEFWNRTYVNRCRAVDLQNSLFALSKILCYYLDKKIFVLIDDYDAPLIEAISSNEKISYHVFLIQDYVNGIIQKLFKPSCLDQYIEYGFVTGTTSYIVSSSLTKIQSIRHYRFLDDHIFTPFFGFNEQEIRNLQQRHRHQQVEMEHNNTLMGIFSGYQIHNTSIKIYNPYLCSKYFNECSKNRSEMTELSSDVIEKGFLTNLIQSPRLKECLLQLSNSSLIQFKLLTHISVDDFRKFYKVGCETGIKDEFDFDIFYSLLYEIGYLSYTDQEGVFSKPKEIANVFAD
ncbi:uncharacterized protein LOC135846652 [Planococcus citri]|uniref:uncharacterized protein LOC135846652 n=1 Tax=Planococcus citri TaxID=170843 RepID=UPI0031F8537C